jgi:aspartyl-tRNA(Asn)/glutamyl-tRNA(Gln) amidotransferase subunit B
VIHELGNLDSNPDIKGSWDTVPSAQLAEIIYLVDQEKITSKSARHVLRRLFSGDPRSVQEVVADENLLVVELDDDIYRENARKVFNVHHDVAAKASAKDVGKVNHLVGQMIRQMASAGLSGAVQPAKAKQFILEELSNRSKNDKGAEEKE